ncbi:MAG: FAD-dependent oxidoreductase [Eubacterium sp.]|nr:FAD-dependent oxidoreductase [Eubacterium sp.]
MEPKFKNLMKPLKVGNFIFKNRLVAANSLPHFLQGPERYPADSVIAHYERKAKGAAVTTCMGINNFSAGQQMPMDADFSHFPDYDLYDTNCQNYLMQLADAIHYYDSIACMGIFVGPPSCYPIMKWEIGEVPPVKPGEMAPPAPRHFTIEKVPAHNAPHEYSKEDLEKVCTSYAEQAEILKMLGYDMVSIHMCYRANLPSKFFSPLSNQRDDDLGGSLENRMKFPLEVLKKVRERVGKNFLIEILWSFEDEEGGYSIDDSVTFLNEAKKYIDLVQLRAKNVDDAHPTGFELKEVPFLDKAAYIKERVDGLVIGSVGGYHYPETCDKAIADGKVDLIYAARAFVSNPDYVKCITEGREDDIVPCLRCNKCHGRGPNDPFVSVCSVNPTIGLEHKLDRLSTPVDKIKNVAIVGGGPAGMRCAIFLDERGHKVTIYEKSDALGGAIKHSDYVSFKWTLKDYKNYLIHQMDKRENITVKLNTTATPELLAKENYDVIISSIGAVPAVPPVKGIDTVEIHSANDAFVDPDSLGHKVVVIGGGEVGVEAAMHLEEKGHEVTVIEMRDSLAADSTMIHYREMLEASWEAHKGCDALLGCPVSEVKPGQVCYTDKDGNPGAVDCDSIVVSAGMRALTDEALSFYGIAQEFYTLGDCKRPATVQQATRAAYAVASRI